jgi:xanthine dehydrogenase accessory factor
VKEILADVDSWLDEENVNIALATVVRTWGSAPRKAGAKMAVAADGRIAGSVSGGCVEGAVVEAALETLESGTPQLLHFGVADETAWEVGLACGGNIDIFVEKMDQRTYQFAREHLKNNLPGSVATVIRGHGSLIGAKVTYDETDFWISNQAIKVAGASKELLSKVTQTQQIRLGDQLELFVDYMRPSPTLIVVGGVHVAIVLTAMAKMLNYRTVVIDPRRSFSSTERFPNVDLLIQQWPQKAFENLILSPATAVALLTHDPRIDDPALKILLESPVFYIGALGSRKTHAARRKRLKNMGYSESQISKIHAPIGLNIEAESPEEIALAVLAEIVSERNQLSPNPDTRVLNNR